MRTHLLLLVVLAVPAAAQTGFWSTPVNLSYLNTAEGDIYAHLSADLLTLRWSTSRPEIPGSPGGWDIYRVSRPDRFSPFGPVAREPGGINTAAGELAVHVMPSETRAFLTTNAGVLDVFETTRPTPTSPWSPLVLVGPLASIGVDRDVSVTADGTYLLFYSDRPGAVFEDIFESHFISGTWTPPIRVAELSTARADNGPNLSPDGLTCHLSIAVSGTSADIHVSRRRLRTDPWGPPVRIAEVNTPAVEQDAEVSADGREMFLSCFNRPGNIGHFDLWYSAFTGLTHQNLPQAGRPLLFHVTVPTRPGAPYQVGVALASTPGLPVPGVGTVPLAADGLFLLSIGGALPGVFTDFGGVLDAHGWATATLSLPAGLPVGLGFSVAAVTYGPGGIDFITNGEDLAVNP
jgi:hypothetical protein